MSTPTAPKTEEVPSLIPYVKLGTSEAEEKRREDEFDAMVRSEAIKGGAIGLVVGTAAVTLASKYSKHFNALSLPYKTFLVSSITTAFLIVEGERATFHSPASRYHYHQVLVEQSNARTEPEAAESPFDQARDWLLARKYQATLGVWVASMGGAFFVLYRNKHLGFGQKLVQARVYAQGAVLAALLATAGLQALAPKKPSLASAHFANGPQLYPWEEEEQKALKVPAPKPATH
ncbi:Replication factor C, subunit RFC4 [Blastocladiella emersonii ATCC 22665]|nr:Replication factor C, subunit RFC4 [Blastocladiella emersonii ATCC 22665]